MVDCISQIKLGEDGGAVDCVVVCEDARVGARLVCWGCWGVCVLTGDGVRSGEGDSNGEGLSFRDWEEFLGTGFESEVEVGGVAGDGREGARSGEGRIWDWGFEDAGFCVACEFCIPDESLNRMRRG